MNLTAWAVRHGVSAVALAELRALWGVADQPPPPAGAPQTETGVMSAVRLEAARKGVKLWRNNVGATYDASGRFIRFGLANDSPQMNRNVKSADLIGVRPVLIGPEHVGHIIGQFVSREVKAAAWRYTGTEREVAQERWAAIVTGAGGDAKFCTGEGTL